MRCFLRELITDKNRTVLIVSHSIETLKELCGRVLWMHDGEVRQIGEPEPVLGLYQAFMSET